METEVKSASKKISDALDAQYGADIALKDRLSKFAKAQQLDQALVELWEQIKHYPTWSKRDDWEKWNRYSFSNIEISTTINQESMESTDSISFSDNHNCYTLETVTNRSWGFENETMVSFSLFEDNVLVFGINTIRDCDEYMTYHRTIDISAFKKQGNWTEMLIKCNNINKIESNKVLINSRYSSADKIQERFKE